MRTARQLFQSMGPKLFAAALGAIAIVTILPAVKADPATAIPAVKDPEWTKIDSGKIGINANYLLDGDFPASQVEGEWTRIGAHWLRYPGGEKSDNHLWSSPPYKKPSPRTALDGPWSWPAGDERFFEPGDGKSWKIDPLDFEEFMALCDKVGAEPILVVAQQAAFKPKGGEYGSITEEELIEAAVAWVRYCREHGHDVRYWEIGNEPYHEDPQSAADFARSWSRFARAMKAEDPSLLIGVNGPTDGDFVAQGDRETKAPWWQTFFQVADVRPDWISLHDYPCYGWMSFEAYTREGVQAKRAVDGVAAAVKDSATGVGPLPILVTETNSADWFGYPDLAGWSHRSSLGHAIVLFDMLGQYFMDHRVKAAIVWNTRWVNHEGEHELWDAFAPDGSLRPSGRTLAIWHDFLPEELTVLSLPPGLRGYAGRGGRAGRGCLYLINASTAEMTVTLPSAPSRVHRFSGSSPDDRAPTWSEVTADELLLTLPACSLTVVEGFAEPL